MSIIAQNPHNVNPPEPPADASADRLVSSSAAGGLTLYEQKLADGVCKVSKAPVIQGWNDAKKCAVIWQPPCNQWRCPVCAQVLQKKAAARAYQGAVLILDNGQDVFFLTLTSHEKQSGARSLVVLADAWKKLVLRARRVQPDGLYFAVPERTKRGVAHLHVITSWSMSKRWWKDNARSCGLGYQVDLQVAMSGPGAGAYALKYVTKQLGEAFRKGARRLWVSKNWPQLPELESAAGWQFEAIPRDQSIQYTYRFWQEHGYDVRLLQRGQRLDELDRIFAEVLQEATRG